MVDVESRSADQIPIQELENPPGVRVCRLGAAWGWHPWIRGKLFFTLPRQLLDLLFERIGRDRFSSELVELEFALSQASAEQSNCAGFWDGRPIHFGYLEDQPLDDEFIEANASMWGKKPGQMNHTLRIANERIRSVRATLRGYLGWLLTNEQFLDEHDALFSRWQSEIAAWRIPTTMYFQPIPELATPVTVGKERLVKFTAEFSDFCSRWKLGNLAAPYLPVPMQPQLGGMLSASQNRQLANQPGAFHIPTIFPLGSRDQLRHALEDAIHSDFEEHLAPWMKIIAASNTAKNPISRYARWFRLQHYWRVVHHRHADALKRNAGKLEEIMAEFLDAKVRLIHEDLGLIRKRLRTDWVLRGSHWST